MQALSPAKFPIEGLSDSDDTKVLQEGLQNQSGIVDIGHAGTSMRFLTAYFAAVGHVRTLTGSDRMKNRPIRNLVDALNSLGADISYLENQGFPPVRTSGKPLSGGDIQISGDVSSQFISALLMIAPVLPDGLNIHITGELVSLSYVRMTLDLMKQMGIKSKWEDNTISISHQDYQSSEPVVVERDWSSASYWYEIAALSGDAELLLEGVVARSLQGDSVVSQMAYALGIKTEYTPEGALLTKHRNLCYLLGLDFTNMPDIVQTMAVTLCLNHTKFRFTGVGTLRVKETDRIAALQNELKKLGYIIEEPEPGVLVWDGKCTDPQPDICISTYDDHRMAMAFAPAAIKFPGLQIDDPEVVTKSYPSFWKDLEAVGFKIDKD